MDKIAVKITDPEEMLLMAEAVLNEAVLNVSSYDSNGVPLPEEKISEQLKSDRLDGTIRLISDIYIGDFDHDEALATTAEQILKRVAPLKKRILGMFRNGVLEEWYRFYWYADESVPDDYLLTMFAMRVRDRMFVNWALRESNAPKPFSDSEQ